ncbi:MAG: LysR family transcriptional regulator [Williamsia sp.]|nr:LysR family transcriptional regulator [Williamsia sp.]
MGDPMELRQVRYFVAVIDTGSFTAAASALSIVQSAVSQQISRLERELRVDLFDRTRRSVRLTSAGRQFEPFARSMLDTERAARSALSPSSTSGPTRIGVPTGLGPLVTAALTALPDGTLPTPVEIVSIPATDREQQVADGRLDAAIIRTPSARSDLVTYALPADELLVITASDHPATATGRAHLADLAAHPLVFTVDAIGEPVYLNTIASCRRAGFEPHVHVLSPGADPLTSLSTIADAWSVFFAAHARQLNPVALGVRFGHSDENLAVVKSVVVRSDRTDIGARIAAAITDAECR